MTEQTDPIRIPIGRNITYAVRGMPEVPNAYGSGFLIPTEVSLTYRASEDSQLGRFHAYVKGQWRRDGEVVPSGEKLPGQHYYGDPSTWPAWLAEEAQLHDPAVSSAGPAAAIDRDTLRISIAETLARTDGHTWGPGQSSLPSGVIERYHRLADAVLAVLPAPDQRAAVLLEAADVGENVANRIHASGDDHRAGGAYDVVDELRRLAGEAQQDETQAQPPHHRWSVETRDAVADQWAPGTPITDRDKAVERYEHVTKNWPTWKDGTPVQRRLVRATTTYTVEQGAVARSGQPETDGETDRA